MGTIPSFAGVPNNLAAHMTGNGNATFAVATERRSAAVTFGRSDGHASLIAVVDLVDQTVTQVVPAEQW